MWHTGGMAQIVCPLVSAEDCARLEALIADRNRAQKHVARARIILGSAARLRGAEDARRPRAGPPAVSRRRARSAEAGVDGRPGAATGKPGKAPLGDAMIHRVVALTCSEPPGEATQWTGRAMAAAAGISLRSVQRIWRAHGLQPHRIRTFKLSKDPQFAAKLQDIVGLYVDPPAHSLVLSVDEKSQIQALDRTQPGLPIKKGKAGTMTFDYKRNGTTTLFAAFDVLEGTVIGRCMQRHRHQEFIRFLNAIERTVPAGKVVHVILDNYATHKHPKVLRWLSRDRDGLLGAQPAPAQTRRVPLHRRPPGRHQPLHRGSQCRARSLRLDRRSRPHPRQGRARDSSVSVTALASRPAHEHAAGRPPVR